MSFFTIPITVRMRKETLEDVGYLLERYPEKYATLSQAVRCAIICLLNKEHQEEENENRRLRAEPKR